MSKKLYLSDKNRHILLIFFLTILIRLPYFFGHITGDEDTFIILGDWISKGGLPEVGLSEGKPPFPFFVYAGVIEIFGKSIFFFRFVGCIFVFLSSLLIYIIFHNYFNKDLAFFSSILYSFLASYIIGNDTLQAFLTDHIGVFFILLSFYYLNKFDNKFQNFFLFGFLIGIAAQSRANLIIIAISSVFIPFFFEKNIKNIIRQIIFIAVGGFFSLLPMLIIYGIKGNFIELYNSSIVGPIDFADQKIDRLRTFLKLIFNGLNFNLIHHKEFINNFKIIISFYFFLISMLGILSRSKKIHFFNSLENKKIFFINYFIIFISLSLILTNRDYPHHLIQIIPFLMFYFIFFHKKYFSKKVNYIIFLIIIIFGITLISKKYFDVAKFFLKNKNLETGVCYQVKKYLDEEKYDVNLNLYAFDCIMLYWVYNKFPIDGLANPFYFSKNTYRHNILEANLDRVFSEKTIYIITNKDYPLDRITNKFTNWNEKKIIEFNKKYTLVKEIENILVYKRVALKF